MPNAKAIERAKTERERLIQELGGKCKEPTCSTRTGLEIHHVNGRDYKVEDLGSDTRVRRYWKEYRAGVPLEVLCGFHNKSHGGPRRKKR